MKVLNEYPGSHHYIENYEKSEYFCIHCGAQEVWQEQSGGDYYCGPEYFCTACSHRFTMQGPNECKNINEFGILKQLRSGITLEPTTKRGN